MDIAAIIWGRVTRDVALPEKVLRLRGRERFWENHDDLFIERPDVAFGYHPVTQLVVGLGVEASDAARGHDGMVR